VPSRAAHRGRSLSKLCRPCRLPRQTSAHLLPSISAAATARSPFELLRLGWTVLATDGTPEAIDRLLQSVPPEASERLTTRIAAFTDVGFPAADLVYAGLSLPFCKPADFEHVWRNIVTALRPRGHFVGHPLGPHDSWAGTPDMNFHSRMEAERLLSEFEIISLREQDEDGAAVGGPKHWHVFHVIARRNQSRGSATG
jgi:SAM-dependent methyltransferase